MAAIIRVKRRLDEDPAESLIIEYKRRRDDNKNTEETSTICLNLVTTVKSKDDAISRQMQKTLRRQQLQANYKSHESQRSAQTRAEKRASAKANRYKIVNSKRTLAAGITSPGGDVEQTVTDTVSTLETCVGPAGDAGPSGAASDIHTHNASSGEASSSSGGDQAISSAARDSEDALILYDVENEQSSQSNDSPTSLPSGSGITLNGQPLLSQQAPPAAENAFVYDLYYLNNERQNYDFRDIENFLSIEAFHDEMALLNEREAECEEAYDEEEDSNDEDNWRNDYPDRDPDEEEGEEDFLYGMDREELEREGSRTYCNRDEMFLADTFGTRLHLFGDSCDEANDSDDSELDESGEQAEDSYGKRGGTNGSSYSSFMRRVHQDLLQQDGEEEG